MISIRLHSPDGPSGLAVDEIDIPKPGPDEALVRVHAAALTRDELEWPVDRLPAIPSYELSGVVEAVGAAVREFVPGDEVFALTDFDRDGVAAEFAAVPAALLAIKPRKLDHVESAAVPLPALSAWQGLFDHGGLERGGRVFITGTSGGVGHLAVQLAAWCGAELVDNGADVAFDTAGDDALERAKGAVRTGGKVVSVAHESPGVTYFLVRSNRTQLDEIARLADEGPLRPEIDSTYRLADARAAFERLAERGKHGKVVLRVSG